LTYFILLTLNILWVYLSKSENKYWLLSIPLWCLLVGIFFAWRNISEEKIARLDTAYWKSADDNKLKDSTSWRGDEAIYKNLEKSRANVKKYNSTFLNTIFLQSVLTFVAQVIGYRKTSLKAIYRWSSIIFGVIFLLNSILEVLLSVVPTGPFF
jgi:hypothetical protein